MQTAQEVIAVFKKYRMPGLESGQMHFADKYGNLGIIVADSMWITKANFQISTNYNLCHPDKDKQTCWRFPIAERILKSKEPGLDSFREICDSTSQKTIASTIYSNIHDLSTGDVWFYFGMDYSKPCHTTIKELLQKGNSALPIYELFPNNELIVSYNVYKKNGIENSIKKLNEYRLTPDRKNQIEGIDFPNVTYFLIQKDGKWVGEFKLEPDEYGYTFLIDGKRVMDPKNTDIITVDGLDYNKITVKNKLN